MRWLKAVGALLTLPIVLYSVGKLLTACEVSPEQASISTTACETFPASNERNITFKECNCTGNKISYKLKAPKACDFNQSVIAYSVFGEFGKYFPLLQETAITVGNYLPGWRVRLYHDKKEGDVDYEELCLLSCKFSWVELWKMWDVRKELSARKNNRFNAYVSMNEMLGVNKRLWRYLVLLDDKVNIAIMRDSDARITQRELVALRHWLESNFTFHVMRDHQEHRATIMAGLFGAKVHKRRDLIRGLALALISSSQNQKYDTDQRMLHRLFWPTVKQDVMAHDSYHCQEKFNVYPTYPFPTRRINFSFVSDNPLRQWVNPSECPIECRPEDHKDWIYC